jgi:hypothetical protein
MTKVQNFEQDYWTFDETPSVQQRNEAPVSWRTRILFYIAILLIWVGKQGVYSLCV